MGGRGSASSHDPFHKLCRLAGRQWCELSIASKFRNIHHALDDACLDSSIWKSGVPWLRYAEGEGGRSVLRGFPRERVTRPPMMEMAHLNRITPWTMVLGTATLRHFQTLSVIRMRDIGICSATLWSRVCTRQPGNKLWLV